MRRLAPLLALVACGPLEPPAGLLVPDETARFVVRSYTSPDLVAWSGGQPVAWSFSSLGAAVVGGELWVTGLQSLAPPTRIEEWRGQLFVDLLATRDLVTWDLRRVPVDGPRGGLIDPAPLAAPGGPELWFARVPGTGDPALGQRETEIFRGALSGGRFTDVSPWLRDRDLVDPAPVLFRGELEVFATRARREVVELAPGAAPRVVLADATVPHAFVVGDELWLLAQRGLDGRKVPVLTRSADGATWSEPAPLDPDPALRSCASPVLARFGDAWVLLCVEERAG